MNNFRLEQKNNDGRVRQIDHFRQVAWIVADEPDLNSLIERLTIKIAEIFQADHTLIGLVSDSHLKIESVLSNGERHQIEKKIPLSAGTFGQVLVTQKSYRASLTPSMSSRPPLEDRFPAAVVLTMPIFNHQNHPLGVIECRRVREDHAFTAADEQLLHIIALQIASGIERAQMFNHLARWNLSMQSLFAFNATLNEELDPPELVRRLVEHTAGFIGADAGLGGLITKQGEIITDGYWHGGLWHNTQVNWPREHSIPGYIFDHQCPYLTNEYRTDRLAYQPFVETYGIHNALSVPFLAADGDVLGFIEIHNKNKGSEPFTWSDVSFVESLAHTMAVTLRNARLMQELDKNRQDLRGLSLQYLNLLEEERTKISRELHDEAGQALIGIKLNLQLLERKIPSELDELREEARALRQQVNHSTSRLRDLARTLRTPALDELGLQPAVQQLVSQFIKQTDIVVHYQVMGISKRLTPEVETSCYRIIQEALTNVVRHSRAQQVWLTITTDEQTVTLAIRDDGSGFDPGEITPGLGLVGIRERVAMLEGDFSVVSSEGSGTEISICFTIDGK